MEPLNENYLWASLLWGSIGGGVLLYGWRQKAGVPLLGGLALTLLSIFAGGALSMSVLAILVLGLMWWVSQ